MALYPSTLIPKAAQGLLPHVTTDHRPFVHLPGQSAHKSTFVSKALEDLRYLPKIVTSHATYVEEEDSNHHHVHQAKSHHDHEVKPGYDHEAKLGHDLEAKHSHHRSPKTDHVYKTVPDHHHSPKSNHLQSPKSDHHHSPKFGHHSPKFGRHSPKLGHNHSPKFGLRHSPKPDHRQSPKPDHRHSPKSDHDHEASPNPFDEFDPGSSPELETSRHFQKESQDLDLETEELLLDVLYSVNALMGESGPWHVASVAAGRANCVPGRKPSNITCPIVRTTVPQVMQCLQDIFSVDEETIQRMKTQVQHRKPVAVTLHLMVREAKVLCRRDSKGPTNTYLSVSAPGNMDQRTQTEKDTLYPKWMQKFDVLIGDLQWDHILLELWHEDEEDDSHRHRILSKLLHNTHSSLVLLASLTLSLKDIVISSLDGWYLFGNPEDGEKDDEAHSTRVRLSGSFSVVSDLTNTGYQAHCDLVKQILMRYLQSDEDMTGTKTERVLWNGRVPDAVTAVLAQHALLLNLSIEAQQLAWWSITSQSASVDSSWALAQLKAVQSSLVLNLYSSEEQSELCSSLCCFATKCLNKIKFLDEYFPVALNSSRVQLTYTLKALQSLQDHPHTQRLLNKIRLTTIIEDVIAAIKEYADEWWNRLAHMTLGKANTVSEHLTAALTITEEVLVHIKYVSNIYNDIFKQEMNIRAVMYIYETIVGHMVRSMQPVIVHVQTTISSEKSTESDHKPHYDFGIGSSLWKLFKNLETISLLEYDIPLAVRVSTGLGQYYRWFMPAVDSWLLFTNHQAHTNVREALQNDTFEPVDAHNSFSQSSVETTAIFHSIKVWWHKLGWPDLDSSSQFFIKILENLYSLCIYYVDTLFDRTDSVFEETSNGLLIGEKVCVAVTNVQHIQNEMERLPEIFGFEFLVKLISTTGNESLATQIKSSVESLTKSKVDDLKAKTHDLIDEITSKMTPTIEKSLDDASEFHESSLLLKDVLDPSIATLRNGLEDQYFHHFLKGFWKVTLKIISARVKNNAKREYVYFETIHKILKELYKFFTPDSGGLDDECVKSEEYTSLLDHLEIMKMDTNGLIAQYYHERCREQNQETLPSKGLLVIRTFFKDADHLAVRIIMARDIVVESEEPRHLPLEYFVKVQLQPDGWFPKSTKTNTKVLKEDPATFDEEFEFDISGADENKMKGILLLTLKDKNRIYADTVLGEAFVALSSIPSDLSEVKNLYLHLHELCNNHCYKSLEILQDRKSDHTAHHFLKKIAKRYPGFAINRSKLTLFI
nr:protein unc-13 homolog 4B-like isoform X2 [Cherax quadricarinatus]